MAKAGRPSKGARTQIGVRIPDELIPLIDAEKEKYGYKHRGEFVAEMALAAIFPERFKPYQHNQDQLAIHKLQHK